MLEAALRERLMARVPRLENRVHPAADLTELLKQGALPQAPASAFVVPAGLRAGGGESGAGSFTQEVDEVVAIVLHLRSPGDVTGGRQLPDLDKLVLEIVEAVAGWAPEDEEDVAYPVIGVFRLLRGQIARVTAGAIFFQLEFACPWQLRVFS